MPKSRRQFLTLTSAALLVTAITGNLSAQAPQNQQQPTPGPPPAFGTGPLVGPEISSTSITEAEKLVQIQMTQPEVDMAASSWRANMAALYERRKGPRKVTLDPALAPATQWNPAIPGLRTSVTTDRFVRSSGD